MLPSHGRFLRNIDVTRNFLIHANFSMRIFQGLACFSIKKKVQKEAKKNKEKHKGLDVIRSFVGAQSYFFHKYHPRFRYKVTVLAKEYASLVSSGKRITSEIACVMWEWPPAVCGRHTNKKSLERAKVWCMNGYAKFMEFAMNSTMM